MSSLLALLLLPVVPGVPLAVLLVLTVPLTALLSRHPLRLVGFGGAMVYSLDSAVLALALWATTIATWTSAGPGGLVSGASDLEVLVTVGLAAWLPWLVGYVAAEATYRKRRPVVRLYNIVLSAVAGLVFVALALSVRAATAQLVVGSTAPVDIGVWDLVAVIVASAGYVGADLLLSAVYVARVEGGRVRDVLADPAGLVSAGTVLAVNSTAVLAAMLLSLASWALLLLVPVAAALVLATRTSTVAMTEHARARALYRGAAGCQSATTHDEVLAAVLAATTDAVAAPARVGTTPPDDEQVGAPFDDDGCCRWLVAGPRANRNGFDADDQAGVATLAALAEQSLARIGALDRIRWMAERDALTGVLNRGAFLTCVSRTATSASAVLFCDVDHFKSVNDTFGHRVGDEVLVHVSSKLRQVVGDQGVVGRIGGDEFVVLLPMTDPVRTDEVRSTILAATEPALSAGGRELRVGLSIGVASVADLGEHADGVGRDDLAEALVERADQRMYADKRSGRPAAVVL